MTQLPSNKVAETLANLTIRTAPEIRPAGPLTSFPQFTQLPLDIKYIIWGLVVQQPRVVQVEAVVEEIQQPKGKGPPKYRIKLSIASLHTFESMYVYKESRQITQRLLKDEANILSYPENIVYIRNFETLWTSFRDRFRGEHRGLEMRHLNGELLFVENIRYLAIDVLSRRMDSRENLVSYWNDSHWEQCMSIFPILEAFKDLKELKLILNLSHYTEPTQRPRELLVGTAHLLAAAGAGEGKFDPGWRMNSQAVGWEYTEATSNCRNLKEILIQQGYGTKFLKIPPPGIPSTLWRTRSVWGISNKGLMLMDKRTWRVSSPYPYIGCTHNLRMKIFQWKKPQELSYRNQTEQI